MNSYYRLQGCSIGPRTIVRKALMTWPHRVSLGSQCTLEEGIYFKHDGIYGTGKTILVGDRVFIGANCEFNIRIRIRIGNDSLIASGCRFIDHDHGLATREVPISQQLGPESPIEIAEDVWIGANCVILKGVEIKQGAVVTKSIPAYEIWGGPARKIGVRP